MTIAPGAADFPLRSRRLDRRWLFPLFLLAFYTSWVALVALRDAWTLAIENWPMALAMALGSYVAGSTPMGGGTIGFPVLVLIFDQPASLGRNFAFAIQSIGMVAASCYIISTRRALAWPALRWGMLGSIIATPLGVIFLAPVVPDLAVKLIFASLWASFAFLVFANFNRWRKPGPTGHTRLDLAPPRFARLESITGFIAGLLGGGTVAAATGVGVDMLLFSLLVLLFRADLKVAVATSVVLMAFTSLVGVATTSATGLIQETPGLLGAWLAAAPVVAVGAPMGAFALFRLPRGVTLLLVALLCLVQFVWTLAQESPGALATALACAGVAVFTFALGLLGRAGRWLDQRGA